MPRLIPESPTFTTGSEKEVWERRGDIHCGGERSLGATGLVGGRSKLR